MGAKSCWPGEALFIIHLESTSLFIRLDYEVVV